MEITKNPKPKFSIAIQSDAIKKMIMNTLGNQKDAQQFVANITSAVSSNYLLQSCEVGSIISAGLTANSLKLPIQQSLGFAYIVPYGNKAQFQIGYKGLIQLALRSGQYEKIGVKAVHEGEIKGLDEFGDLEIKFDLTKQTNPVVGYYAYFKLMNGSKQTLYMSNEECEAHGKKYSKAYNNLWAKNFDVMAKKTVLKLLLSRYGIMSVEIQNALQYDQAVIHKDSDKDILEYVDNPMASKPVEVPTMNEEGEVEESETLDTSIEETL